MRHSIFVGVVVAALFFVGCGDSDGGGVLTGASPVGVWVVDMDAVTPELEKGIDAELKGEPEAQRAATKEARMKMVTAMMSKLSAEVKSDGTYALVDPDEDSETGKWKLEGDVLVVTPDNPDKEAPPKIVFKDDKLHLSGPELPFTLIMKRK